MQAIYVDKDIPKVLIVKALRPLWPQVVWTPLSPAGLEQAPDPDLRGPRWLRIRNTQCGICATDLTVLNIKLDPGISVLAIPGIQRVYLGHENVGEVTEVGSAVSGYSVGDRVVFAGLALGTPNCETLERTERCHACVSGWPSLCEYASEEDHPLRIGGGWGDTYVAHEAAVWPVPEDLSDDQASLIEPASCALRGVLRRVPEPGEHVLIVGAGIIGLLTLQSVKVVAPDAHVTVMARYPQQIEVRCR
jgi:threonine dehydrogenase-like Zn-dependent dehydrogenase